MNITAPTLAMLLVALPATAAPAQSQTRTAINAPAAEQLPDEVVRQNAMIDRIQRADRQATASICADGCRGEIRGSRQPRNPFARSVDYDFHTGLPVRPDGEVLPPSGEAPVSATGAARPVR